MRKNIIIWFTTLLVALFAGSCSQELPTPVKEQGLRFCLKTEIPAMAQVKSAVSGTEGIHAMQLLCFDSNGLYIGLGTVFASGEGTIQGTVPSSTVCIHFIANAGLVPQEDWRGLSENVLINSLTASTSNTHIIYWGFHREADPEAMYAWLNASPANTVLLLRDRAKITMSEPDQSWDHDASASVTENILQARFCVCNGRVRGQIAPFDRATLSFSYDGPLTLPEETSRFQGSPDELSPCSGAQFLFEDEGKLENPVKVILEITYRSVSAGVTTDFIKYHQVLLMKDDYSLYEIRRNHQYNIIIGNLPSALGYDSFDDAVAGNPSNNQTVVVQEIVPHISSAEYDIHILGGTTHVFQAPVEGNYAVIHFTYLKSGAADPSIGTDNFSVTWLSNKYVAYPDMDILLRNGTEPGTFDILVDLYQPITEDLKSGKLLLMDKTNGLARFINVYSITAFDFNASLEPAGGLPGQYRLNFNIPENYPAALFPLTVRIATEDFKATSSQNADKALGVIIEDTDAVIGTSWDYWYTYQADAPGSHTVMLEVVAGRTGTLCIYLCANHFGTLDANGICTSGYVRLEAII